MKVLFIVNRFSATGCNDAIIEQLHLALEKALGRDFDVQTEIVNDHPQAKRKTGEFLKPRKCVNDLGL